MRSFRKIKINLETLRAVYHLVYRVAGWFIDLDVTERGLLNSRLIEYPFVLERLVPLSPGTVLDVGCADGANFLAPTLATLGWKVYGIDTRSFKLTHPNFHFVIGDIRAAEFPDDFFDCAYAVSTLEHVGLAGRYGVRRDDGDGDLRAVKEIRRVLKPGGIFLFTVPYGLGGVIRPFERVYSRARLQELVDNWAVRYVAYHYLDQEGAWHEIPEELASRTKTPGGVCIALLELVNESQH
jgi:SAM-dependent methyltransferase